MNIGCQKNTTIIPRLMPNLVHLAIISVIICCGLLEFEPKAFGQNQKRTKLLERYSLLASPYSIMRAESLTASTGSGTSSLFYNPAALAFGGISLGLVGAEYNVGLGKDVSDALDTQQDNTGYTRVAKTLDNNHPFYGDAALRVIDIALPYFAINQFTQLSAEVTNPALRNDDLYHAKAQANLGLIMGIALSYEGFAIGYSGYLVRRVGIDMDLSEDQVQTIRQETETDAFDEDSLPFRDITRVSSGGTKGHNFGILYRPIDDNLLALGLSVLNAGNSVFEDRLSLNNSKYNKLENNIVEEAQNIGITTDLPADLKQIANVGLAFGLGGGSNDYFKLEATIDYNDINGDTIDNHVATSVELGLELPDKSALAFSMPLNSESKTKYHMGLYKLTIASGSRPGSYSAEGGTVGLHFGWDKKISIITLDCTSYQGRIKGGAQQEEIKIQGLKYDLSLTLITF